MDSTTSGLLATKNRASLSETPHYSFEYRTSNPVPLLTIKDRPKSPTSVYFHPAANMAARPNNDAPIPPPDDEDDHGPPGPLEDAAAEAPPAEDAEAPEDAAAAPPALPDYGTLTAAQIVMVNQGTPTVYPDKISTYIALPYKEETEADIAGTRRQGSIGLWRDNLTIFSANGQPTLEDYPTFSSSNG